jgi:serine/threonine protein kinase
MVAMCLVKDPSKRPSATKLLKQPFFKQARSSDFFSRKLLEGLPGLGARYQALKVHLFKWCIATFCPVNAIHEVKAEALL